MEHTHLPPGLAVPAVCVVCFPSMSRVIEIIVRGVWVESGHVLVCRNVKRGHRFLPGGHIEFDEPTDVALAREMYEEAGVRVRVGELIGILESRFAQNRDRKHEINLVYAMHPRRPIRSRQRKGGPVGPPPAVLSREEHIAFDWIPLPQLSRARLLPEGMAKIIRSNLSRVA